MSVVYEQERLLLTVQEAIATAIDASGKTRRAIAQATGVSPAAITQALGRDALTLQRAATIAHAAGYRIVVSLEKL